MAMAEARKAALMAYCRLDDLGEVEAALLERFYSGAVAYMTEAGVSEPGEGTERRAQYDGLIDAMVLDAWDNRGSQAAGYSLAENPVFRRTLNQLKLTEPVSESDTGTGA